MDVALINGCPTLIEDIEKWKEDSDGLLQDLIVDTACLFFGAFGDSALKDYALDNGEEIMAAIDFFTTYDIDPDEFGIESKTIDELCILSIQLLAMELICDNEG